MAMSEAKRFCSRAGPVMAWPIWVTAGEGQAASDKRMSS